MRKTSWFWLHVESKVEVGLDGKNVSRKGDTLPPRTVLVASGLRNDYKWFYHVMCLPTGRVTADQWQSANRLARKKLDQNLRSSMRNSHR